MPVRGAHIVAQKHYSVASDIMCRYLSFIGQENMTTKYAVIFDQKCRLRQDISAILEQIVATKLTYKNIALIIENLNTVNVRAQSSALI